MNKSWNVRHCGGRRTFNQVVTLGDPTEELVEVRIPLIARNRKASHRNITVVQLS